MLKQCKATIYITRDGTEPRQCKAQASGPGGYCVSHDPEIVSKRSDQAHRQAMARKAKRDLETVRLFLSPVLDNARAARLQMEGPRAKLGAQVIIDLLEGAVREEAN